MEALALPHSSIDQICKSTEGLNLVPGKGMMSIGILILLKAAKGFDNFEG